MIVNQEFLEKIKKEFDLNIYEVKIWTALLSRGVASAGELFDISGVPRSRCYDVLESLEKKGFIVMKIGKPIRYIAISPPEIIERMKKHVVKSSIQHIKSLDKIEDTEVFKELDLLHSNGISPVYAENLSNLIKGRRLIHSTMKSMLQNAKKSVILFTTPNSLKAKINILRGFRRKQKKSGLKVVVYVHGTVDPKLVKELKDIDIRSTNISTRAMIVDQTDLLFTLTDADVDQNYDAAVHIKSPYVAVAFENMILAHHK